MITIILLATGLQNAPGSAGNMAPVSEYNQLNST